MIFTVALKPSQKMVRSMPIGNQVQGYSRNTGFTFIGLLVVIVISGIALAGVGIVWHQEMQRERENELLFIGDAYRQAIGQYYESTPSGVKQYPATLKALILDNRFPSIKRHLRTLYADPMTKSQEWGLDLQAGRIVGVYSLSNLPTLKKSGFSADDESFKLASQYSEWKFIYSPTSGLAANTEPSNNL
jgi:type II secretory pathway pseudopilin PulG